jgi:uncharacterized membrane protein
VGALPGFARSEELPAAYRCSGNEPFWGLVVEGAQATYTELGEPERELEGGFRSLDWAGTFVFRGRAVGEQGAWVAVIERRSCLETMAEEEEGGGEMPFAVVLSRPDGEARLGCCRPAERSVAPSSGD